MVDFDSVFDLPFFLDRSEGSVIREYIAAHNDEMQDFGDKLEEVMESHQIDNATGDELDQIGASFGVLGRRRGRSDQEYRIYLKSLVQSFRGRGTVPGIISAVAAGLNTDETDVEVVEDYQNIEYIIRLTEWSSHSGSTVEELAELADASVAKLKRVEYLAGEDEMGVTDSVDTTVSTILENEDVVVEDSVFTGRNSISLSDAVTVDDLAEVDKNKIIVQESAVVDDAAQVNPNTVTQSDSAGVVDTAEVNPNKNEVTDDVGAADTVQFDTRTTGQAKWEDTQDDVNWDFFEWSQLTDAGTITTDDDVGITDSVAVTTGTIEWESGDWETMGWAASQTTTVTEWESGSWETMKWV